MPNCVAHGATQSDMCLVCDMFVDNRPFKNGLTIAHFYPNIQKITGPNLDRHDESLS